MKTFEDHFADYQRDGYTIFRQYRTPDQRAFLRQRLDLITAQRFNYVEG